MRAVALAVGGLLCVFGFGVVVAGCVADSDVALSVALSGSPETLDPHATTSTLTFQVARSLYDTLLEPDASGRLVGGIAEEWRFADGARRLELTLRRGVRFHNGMPLTAKDVKRSLERLRGERSPRAADYANIADIEIVDDHRLALHLSAPQSSLLATLASGWSAILPSALIDEGHQFATVPVGSGPFRFSHWRMGSQIAMVRNDDYWREGSGNIERIAFNIITENAVRVQGLAQGSVDVVDLVDPVDIPALRENEEINVEQSLSSLAMVIAINTAAPPLSDLRVRRAISHAIDKQRVLDQAYGGGLPIATFMDYSDPYYPDIADEYDYDPLRARQLIAEVAGGAADASGAANANGTANASGSADTAGVADANGAALLGAPLVITVPQNFEPHVRAAELYQHMLTEVGLASEVELVDWPTWISRVYTAADYQLTVIGHTGHLDPAPRFGEYAYTRFADPALEELLPAAARAESPDERRALYGRALAIFAEGLPFVFVGTNYRYIVTRKSVSGVVVDTKLDTFDFRDVVKM